MENLLPHSFSLEVSLAARVIVYGFNPDCFFHNTNIQLSWLLGDRQNILSLLHVVHEEQD